jgi:hypothetical protein
MTPWAKVTPWASFFNAQRDMTGQWIARVASLTRKLWSIEEDALETIGKAIKQFAKGAT